MQSLEFHITNVCKRFDRREVLRDVHFNLNNGSITGIIGSNGSGKSTLVKILASLLSPTSGTVRLSVDGKTIDAEQRPQYIGFVAPYLALYEEFSPMELLTITAKMRGQTFDVEFALHLLKTVRLAGRHNDEIRGFSSGMKQRMKYALALLHRPPIFIFDEPMTNLDAEGMATVELIIREHKQQGGIVVLATNDERDIMLCDATMPIPSIASTKKGQAQV